MSFLRRILGKPKTHSVEVHDVRPEKPGEFDPYFAAICECGWVSAPHGSEAEARSVASRHDLHVVEALQRPLG